MATEIIMPKTGLDMTEVRSSAGARTRETPYRLVKSSSKS